MLLIIGIAAAAAVAVLTFEHYTRTRPDSAEVPARRAHQLAAVVLVMSRAVEGIVEALALEMRPQPAMSSGPRRLVDMWDEEDYS